MVLQEKVSKKFTDNFKIEPTFLIRAPGRVNLIGEHTDYNDGFVMPMAVNRAIWIALRPRQDNQVVLYSLDFNQNLQFSLDDIMHSNAGWGEYVKGTAWALKEHGYSIKGWEGIIAGDIPIGAGLSSSAAIELGIARAFSSVSGFDWNPVELAKIAQFAENKWVGVNCGIMDQMIVAVAEKDHAVLIDCRSLEFELVPLPKEVVVIILDSTTRRGLVDSAYNERRMQCELAAKHFGVKALRDISVDTFISQETDLKIVTRKRAKHVITENERVLKSMRVLKKNDVKGFGEILNQSHTSLRDDFEVSRKELDIIVDLAQNHPSCFGARMTGGGFGGCAVALVKKDKGQTFAEEIKKKYSKATGLVPNIYITQATDGVRVK